MQFSPFSRIPNITRLATGRLYFPSSLFFDTHFLLHVYNSTFSKLQVIEDLTQQLFALYRCRTTESRYFALTFLPSLISIHLRTYKFNEVRSRYKCVEVLLLGIYNLEVVNEDGHPIMRTFRIPSLTKPSIYHEPSSIATQQTQSQTLTEHALYKHETIGTGDLAVTAFGPYPEFDQILASNRMDILTVLLKIYNENLSGVPKQSLKAVCNMCMK